MKMQTLAKIFPSFWLEHHRVSYVLGPLSAECRIEVQKTIVLDLGTFFAKDCVLANFAIFQLAQCKLVTNSSDNFTNLIHDFFYEFFSVWAVEKEKKVLVGSKNVFYLSLAVKKEIIINIR